jgi:hypothetical protein
VIALGIFIKQREEALDQKESIEMNYEQMKPHEQAEYEISKENIEKNVPAMLAVYPSIAKLTMTYYKELIQQGFSETQALYIIARQGCQAGTNGTSE